jgi:hypothetical protein
MVVQPVSGQLRLRLAWARPAMTPSPSCWPHAALGAYVVVARLARLVSGTGERLELGGSEEARWLVGGGRGKQAARVRRWRTQ